MRTRCVSARWCLGNVERIAHNRSPSQLRRQERVTDFWIIAPRRTNSAHLHRPWRAILRFCTILPSSSPNVAEQHHKHRHSRAHVRHVHQIDRGRDAGAAAAVPVVCRPNAGRRQADGSRSDVVFLVLWIADERAEIAISTQITRSRRRLPSCGTPAPLRHGGDLRFYGRDPEPRPSRPNFLAMQLSSASSVRRPSTVMAGRPVVSTMPRRRSVKS